MCPRKNTQHTLQGINISHLGKRKIIFKMPFLGDMLVPWKVIRFIQLVLEWGVIDVFFLWDWNYQSKSVKDCTVGWNLTLQLRASCLFVPLTFISNCPRMHKHLKNTSTCSKNSSQNSSDLYDLWVPFLGPFTSIDPFIHLSICPTSNNLRSEWPQGTLSLVAFSRITTARLCLHLFQNLASKTWQKTKPAGAFSMMPKAWQKRNVCQNDAIKNCQQTEHCTISFSEPSDDLKGTSYRRLQHHRIVPQLFMAHLTLSTEAITFLPVSQPVAQNLTSHTCITSAWKSILVVFKGLPRSFGNGFV